MNLYRNFENIKLNEFEKILFIQIYFGDWGWGIGDGGLGPIPNPQSPIPNPLFQSKYIFLTVLKQK